MKTIKHFKVYLDHIDTLSKTLPKDKKEELENILKSILVLLVAFKKSSNLGKVKFSWEE